MIFLTEWQQEPPTQEGDFFSHVSIARRVPQSQHAFHRIPVLSVLDEMDFFVFFILSFLTQVRYLPRGAQVWARISETCTQTLSCLSFLRSFWEIFVPELRSLQIGKTSDIILLLIWSINFLEQGLFLIRFIYSTLYSSVHICWQKKRFSRGLLIKKKRKKIANWHYFE